MKIGLDWKIISLLLAVSIVGVIVYKNSVYSKAKIASDDEIYNTTKIELDYYMCLDSARLIYENLWKEHCKDRGSQGYCDLPLELQNNMRWSYYEKQKDMCYSDYQSARN